MILIKGGIAKTIPDSKAGVYKAAGWVEIEPVKAPEETPEESETADEAPEETPEEETPKPKKTRAKKEA